MASLVIDETPAPVDLKIQQGDTFTLPLRFKITDAAGNFVDWRDLTGYTGLAQIRTSAGASSVLATFTCTLGNQTTAKGTITLSLAATIVAALSPTTTQPFVWDFQTTDGSGTVKTWMAGLVTINAEVSR